MLSSSAIRSLIGRNSLRRIVSGPVRFYHRGCATSSYFVLAANGRTQQLPASKRLTIRSCATATEEKTVPPPASEEQTVEEPGERMEFQAETRMLLDIVARSLYSEREVFIRELISNSSDALEKFRYLQMTNAPDVDPNHLLHIRISINKSARTICIEDTGIGMTKQEMIDNLGTIARSGSKAFMKQLEETGEQAMDNIIGQFGVGFYSAFMVADKVEVVTKSYKPNSKAYKWVSDGCGFYEISESTERDEPGTSVTVFLKRGEVVEFTDSEKVKEIVNRYSSFVGSPIIMGVERLNTQKAIWTLDPKEITEEEHLQFFRFVSSISNDRPKYILHYKTDAPVNIRALLYVPSEKPSVLELSQEIEPAVSLFSRKVLIQSRAKDILPRWMRFFKGVIDSEDIPLNLSRELLQKSALLQKIKDVISTRCFKFFRDQMKKDIDGYIEFHNNYGICMKEAIAISSNQQEKEEIAKLLLFESSNRRAGTKVNLTDYCANMQEGQDDIYYLSAPSREIAETSPYFEAMKEKNLEVLFCYEVYDELVMLALQQFERKNVIAVEKFLQQEDLKEGDKKKPSSGPFSEREMNALLEWIQMTLGSKRVNKIKVSSRLGTYPCIVTCEEMGAARHYMKTAMSGTPQDQRYFMLKPTLEVNPNHAVVQAINELKKKDENLAELMTFQMYDNAMVCAGLLEDPRLMVNRINTLMGELAQKHIRSKDTILRP